MDTGLSIGSGLSFIRDATPTPPSPPADLGILLEDLTFFLMLEGGVYYLLQE
jgi:hypothetical protein